MGTSKAVQTVHGVPAAVFHITWWVYAISGKHLGWKHLGWVVSMTAFSAWQHQIS